MKKILLVQDNPLLARLWKTALENSNFTVCVASDGKKGIEAAKEEKPDLILVDSIMPDLDGFDFCRTVRSMLELKDIPEIILVSNYNLQSEIERAKEMGVDDYWLKYELTPGIILKKIKKLLDIPICEEDEGEDKCRSIPDLLYEAGIIEKDHLNLARQIERDKNITAADAILQMGLIPEKDREYLKELIYRSDFVDLDRFMPSKEALKAIPDYVAAQYNVLPLALKENNLLVAMANPAEVHDIDYLSQISGCIIHTSYAPVEKIKRAIMRFYAGKEFREEAEKFKQKTGDKEKEVFLDGRTLWEVIDERPVVEFVDSLIFNAIEEKASDIHIEPYDNGVLLRYRIDGILHDIHDLPKEMCKAVIARIKVMSNMNVVERRLPQDGRFNLTFQKKSVDFRVSTVPVIYGEKVVIRILTSDETLIGLEHLGMDGKVEEKYRSMVSRPYGMVLITGPTGSGKTTTLYATLRFLMSPEKNIVSIEDPVEYSINRVNQIQVNPAINLTFANILRHVLRQDPNIIMVGEIRDLETAELSAQAALTGHLVLGTLHTNDAPSGLIRLIDMGLPPFIVASTVEGIIAQRLMRRICPQCKTKVPLSENYKKRLPHLGGSETVYIYEGAGCPQCRNSGYKGRTGIFEMFPVSQKIRRSMIQDLNLDNIIALAKDEGMVSLRDAALAKVWAGISTIQEMWRVTQDED